MNWFGVCVLFTLTLAALVIGPLLRHPTLPRRKKIILAALIFLWLVPVALALYGWVGMPPMAVL